MISKEDRDLLEKKIRKDIIKTEKKVADLAEVCKPIGPENAIGRLSRMDAIQNKSVLEASFRQTKKKLAGLQDALRRINKEDFGICRICENAIQKKRLYMMPESRKCVRCS